MEEELIEEIIRIIEQKDVFKKIKDRIEERQNKEQSTPIHLEEDWGGTNELLQEQITHQENKEKVQTIKKRQLEN